MSSLAHTRLWLRVPQEASLFLLFMKRIFLAQFPCICFDNLQEETISEELALFYLTVNKLKLVLSTADEIFTVMRSLLNTFWLGTGNRDHRSKAKRTTFIHWESAVTSEHWGHHRYLVGQKAHISERRQLNWSNKGVSLNWNLHHCICGLHTGPKPCDNLSAARKKCWNVSSSPCKTPTYAVWHIRQWLLYTTPSAQQWLKSQHNISAAVHWWTRANKPSVICYSTAQYFNSIFFNSGCAATAQLQTRAIHILIPGTIPGCIAVYLGQSHDVESH